MSLGWFNRQTQETVYFKCEQHAIPREPVPKTILLVCEWTRSSPKKVLFCWSVLYFMPFKTHFLIFVDILNNWAWGLLRFSFIEVTKTWCGHTQVMETSKSSHDPCAALLSQSQNQLSHLKSIIKIFKLSQTKLTFSEK